MYGIFHSQEHVLVLDKEKKKTIFLSSRKISMAFNTKFCFLTSLVIIYLFTQAFLQKAHGAGECGKTPIRSAAVSLSPCLSAAGNVRAKVPPMCCTKVNALIRTAPRCLCAVLLSPLTKQAGIKPAIAITIPKRCNIKNRPAGKKCGSYTLP